MAVNEKVLEAMKERLGYNGAEWEMWLKEPKNLELVTRVEEFSNCRMVAEVIKGRACAVGHKVGDKLIFNGLGAFIRKEPQGEVCAGILVPLLPLVCSVFYGLLGGVDVQKLLLFPKISCVDVGVENGGWGKVIVELRVEKV
jgi:uncharacterized repeat protein (TIGR04076 family)